MASSTERITVKLPDGFDPSRHSKALEKKIADKHGGGFEIDSISEGVAVATRQVTITEVSTNTASRTKDVRLPRTVKPSDGDKMAVKLADQHGEGWEMTRFEPFLGRATLTQLTDEMGRCRGAAAVALGVKPWDVQVAQRPDGGFDLELPKSYVPSKHDSKLEEVATGVVGYDGWYLKTDPQKLRASLIPSAPPTFPNTVGFPVKKLGRGSLDESPFGIKLPLPGETTGEEIAIDWTASAFSLLAGTPGSGKRQPLDSRVPVPVSGRFPNGWATIGKLNLGDEVFAASGEVANVDYLSPIIEDPIYELMFSDGQSVRCDPAHLWTVSDRQSRNAHLPRMDSKRAYVDVRRRQELERLTAVAALTADHALGADTRTLAQLTGLSHQRVQSFARQASLPFRVDPGSGQPRFYPVDEFVNAWKDHLQGNYDAFERQPLLKTVTAEEMASAVRVEDGRSNYAVRTAGSLLAPEATLPISPYLLGAWLGDGTSRNSGITVGSQDYEEMYALLTSEWPSVSRIENNSRSTAKVIHFGRPMPEKCLHGHNNWKVPVLGYSRYCLDCRGDGVLDRSNLPLSEMLIQHGLRQNKHVPAAYLRSSHAQRLALLQGLMDTDGSISESGSCELTLCNQRLASGALELIRSLGIKCSMNESPSSITEADPDNAGIKRRRTVGTRYRMHFTTDLAVFRLSRKAERVPSTLRDTQNWIYVTEIRWVGRALGRCIRIDHPSHLYLTEGFIPTHNTVALNALIAHGRSNGSELVIVDDPSKAVDFMWCKDYVRDGGWGCDSDKAAVATLQMVYNEGRERAKVLAQKGYVNWLDMPEKERYKPIFIVVDEVSALLVTDKIPGGIPKDHPLVREATERNLMKIQLGALISKIVAEQRFVGMRMILSTQVTNNNTGVPPTLKAKIGHKMLQGVNPSKSARQQSFSDESAVPHVPDNVKSGGKAGKGVGVADLEGQSPAVYKSYFATTDDYRSVFERLGLQKTSQPEPTAAQIAKYTPSLDDEADEKSATAARRAAMKDPGADQYGEAVYDADGKPLKGAALAAAQSKALAAHS
ncbi:hypothetical protein [Arthrobacter sp. H14]|uniref:hypothetical protein n=1 Tax=Arthrobacter sp. H14 TaxID=1312959 RepID=UPI00047E6D23|nr:hypothetical protein [Arthrobacter sp. H14]